MGEKPYVANGSTSDPREQIMWDFYVEGLAKGIANASDAARKAGYEDATSKQITIRSWFIERLEGLQRKEMLTKAEKKLDKALTYNVEDEDGNVKTDLLRIQVDVSKHLTSTLGKKAYATGIDVTSDGKALNITGMSISKE